MKQQSSKSSMITISITTLIINFFLIISNSPSIHSVILQQKTLKNSMIIKMKTTNLIQTTCKATPKYDLCISTLESDPRIVYVKDVTDLGLIIVDALKAKAISTFEIIYTLKMSNPEYDLPLFECSVSYNAILKADVPEAIEGLRKGVPKFAEAGMDDVALEVRVCEQSFQGLDYYPLSDLNKDVYDLSLVAKSIIRLLL